MKKNLRRALNILYNARFVKRSTHTRTFLSKKIYAKYSYPKFTQQQSWLAVLGILSSCCIYVVKSNNQPAVVSDASLFSKLSPGNDSDKPMTIYSISDAVDKACPALVNIRIERRSGFGLANSSGSGFIFDGNRKLVATNYHVVANGESNNITVTLSNGTEYVGHVQSFDALSDLAIVQLKKQKNNVEKKSFFSHHENAVLPEIKLGTSGKLRVGEWVIALGSPMGMQNTVTAGIVSATNRSAGELGMAKRRTDYIQTDAAINQGNSGGPLINLKGEVVGINTMKLAGLSSIQGISFAIPIDTAKVVLAQLQSKGRVDRPYIGLQLVSARKYLEGQDNGDAVVVVKVKKGSPAALAGFEVGDVIEKVAGNFVTNSNDVIRQIGYQIGKEISFKVIKKDGQKCDYVLITVAHNFK